MENIESKIRRINQAVSDLKQTGVMSEGEARKALFALDEAGYEFVKYGPKASARPDSP
jgi:hypothetical protein